MHSFLAPDNAIGFGDADFFELILLALLVALLQLRPRLERATRWMARRVALCAVIIAVLPVALRLALLPHHPVPTPDNYDEFEQLFVADTLRHFRLANPAHPLRQFFEPTYSSIYPLGQGLVLALGGTLFGLPWAGVVLSVAASCALCYWMLLGWTTRFWALIGALFAVVEFGPLNEWMNSYSSGAVSAIAGCLVFGALPRLRECARRRDAALLGAGIGVQLLTRPYESILLVLSVAAFFGLLVFRERSAWRGLARVMPVAFLAVLPAATLMLLQNKQVTGSWTTLTFTVQGRDTVTRFVSRLAYRVRFYRFFFLPPLYLAMGIFVATIRKWTYLWVAGTLLLFALGSNLLPHFYPRYIAAVACLFVLASVTGLQKLAHWNVHAAALILFVSFASFCLWYGAHLFENETPGRRTFVNGELARFPGKQLVFVRYWPNHMFQDEWVYNAADIDAARVVWAHDLGATENEKLRRYYPDRTVWRLEPDARPPKLSRYGAEPQGPFLDVK